MTSNAHNAHPEFMVLLFVLAHRGCDRAPLTLPIENGLLGLARNSAAIQHCLEIRFG